MISKKNLQPKDTLHQETKSYKLIIELSIATCLICEGGQNPAASLTDNNESVRYGSFYFRIISKRVDDF
jgi:hypothetical protein